MVDIDNQLNNEENLKERLNQLLAEVNSNQVSQILPKITALKEDVDSFSAQVKKIENELSREEGQLIEDVDRAIVDLVAQTEV